MSKRKTTRRQFLSGHAALQAAEDLADRHLPEPQTAKSRAAGCERQGTYLLQIARRAMACQFQVFLNAGQHLQATEAALEALDLVEQLEDQLTVYREASEVCLLNRQALQGPVRVEQQLFGLLTRAVQIHDATEGAFDITSGPLSRLWGFHRRQGRFPSQHEIATALDRVGSRWLELSPEQGTVSFQKAGMEINLGGIGKGYALERCQQLLSDAGVHDFLMHGGQSSILARGARLADPDTDSGWLVAVKHPWRSEQRIAEIWLCDQALATSGSGSQFFHYQGRRYGHVLDPRTGKPAEGVLSATVISSSATDADALATAFYVMGVEQVQQFCQQHPDISALLVCAGPRAGSLQCHRFAMERLKWRSLLPAD